MIPADDEIKPFPSSPDADYVLNGGSGSAPLEVGAETPVELYADQDSDKHASATANPQKKIKFLKYLIAGIMLLVVVSMGLLFVIRAKPSVAAHGNLAELTPVTSVQAAFNGTFKPVENASIATSAALPMPPSEGTSPVPVAGRLVPNTTTTSQGDSRVAVLQTTIEKLAQEILLTQERLDKLEKSIKPQPQLPTATAPIKTAFKSPSIRAATDDGNEAKNLLGLSGARRASLDFNLKSVVGSRAWIARATDGKLFSVTVGDEIPGFGIVKKVDSDTGAVSTTQGVLR